MWLGGLVDRRGCLVAHDRSRMSCRQERLRLRLLRLMRLWLWELGSWRLEIRLLVILLLILLEIIASELLLLVMLLALVDLECLGLQLRGCSEWLCVVVKRLRELSHTAWSHHDAETTVKLLACRVRRLYGRKLFVF